LGVCGVVEAAVVIVDTCFGYISDVQVFGLLNLQPLCCRNFWKG
jgi:hypothetical protein